MNAPAPTSARRRVLIVDDDEDIRLTLCEVLADVGYDACGARDGAEALNLLRSERPEFDLIFLDLMMPGMNGWQFLEAQRADPALSGIPVVVITAASNAGARAEELGAEACVMKPLKLTPLLDLVRRYLP